MERCDWEGRDLAGYPVRFFNGERRESPAADVRRGTVGARPSPLTGHTPGSLGRRRRVRGT